MNRPVILVLGAGYGGLTTVVNLQKRLGQQAEIILINKNDYHYETTWLHEVGAGTISPEAARYPIAKVITRDVRFVQATVESVAVKSKKIGTSAGEFTYDYLVIGLGFEGETFGIPGLKEYALALTNIETARYVREHIEYQFASWSLDEVRDDSKLTIIVGRIAGLEEFGNSWETSGDIRRLADDSRNLDDNVTDIDRLAVCEQNVCTDREVDHLDDLAVCTFDMEGWGHALVTGLDDDTLALCSHIRNVLAEGNTVYHVLIAYGTCALDNVTCVVWIPLADCVTLLDCITILLEEY